MNVVFAFGKISNNFSKFVKALTYLFLQGAPGDRGFPGYRGQPGDDATFGNAGDIGDSGIN